MANKITYGDKVGIVPKVIHTAQFWDDDANEIKNKHNLNDDRISAVEIGQTVAALSYATLALLPVTGVINTVYKVTNDATVANNGYYHWDGAVYVKDASTANGTITDGNTEAVNGGTVFDEFVSRDFIAANHDQANNIFDDNDATVSGFIDNAGILQPGSFESTDYIDLTRWNYILIRTKLFGGASVCFYNSSKVFISEVTTIKDDLLRTYNVDKVVDAVYIRACIRSADVDDMLLQGFGNQITIENLADADEATNADVALLDARVVDNESLLGSIENGTLSDNYVDEATGLLISSVLFKTTDYILIYGKESLSITTAIFGDMNGWFYDSSFDPLQVMTLEKDVAYVPKTNTEIVPAGAYYMRIPIRVEQVASLALSAITYNLTNPASLALTHDLDLATIETIITPTTEGFINADGTYSANTNGWQATDYVRVYAGDYEATVFIEDTYEVFQCRYDLNKNFIDYLTTPYQNLSTFKFTITEDSYIRVSSRYTDIILKSFSLADIVHKIQVGSNIINGSIFTSYGDSITALNTWQEYMNSYYGFTTMYNRGIGGTTATETASVAAVTLDGEYISRPGSGTYPPPGTEGVDYIIIDSSGSNTERVDTIPVDTQLLTVFFGANDAVTAQPLGTVNDAGVATFYGAWNNMVTNIFARVPLATVVFIDLFSHDTETTYPSNFEDYREAIRVISKKWKIALVELSETGINSNNINDYTSDGIHPNDAGSLKIANAVIGALNSKYVIKF